MGNVHLELEPLQLYHLCIVIMLVPRYATSLREIWVTETLGSHYLWRYRRTFWCAVFQSTIICDLAHYKSHNSLHKAVKPILNDRMRRKFLASIVSNNTAPRTDL